jgi:hypothetical protein
MNFLVYIEGIVKYFIPISTVNKKKEMIEIAKIEIFQSVVDAE